MKKNHLKRIAALALCAALTLGTATQALAYNNISNWAVGEVTEADTYLGLLPAGLKEADMQGAITRGEMCQIALTAYEKIIGSEVTPQDTDYFTDTDADYICAAYELGIVTGYTDGTFLPDQILNRQEFCQIVYNLDKSLTMNVDASAMTLDAFTDGRTASVWALNGIKHCVRLGIVQGSSADGKAYLYPYRSTSRQEAIIMFKRCYTSLSEYYHYVVNQAGNTVSTKVGKLLEIAMGYEGSRYVYGGTSPSGFDCSGFCQYCYRMIGININRTAADQAKNGVAVEFDQLQAGDLVFFYTSGNGYISHVGIYIGDGQFIHAANPSRGVVITKFSGDGTDGSYYMNRYACARRIINS